MSETPRAQFNMEMVDVEALVIARAVIDLVPEKVCRDNHLLPIDMMDGTLLMAISDPLDLEPLDHLRFVVNCKVDPVLATKEAIKRCIERYYGSAA